jgi:N-acetylmuramoyl-L-alanine amidase
MRHSFNFKITAMSNRPKIMIDPGHGGKDSGAVGPEGLREKDVVLAVAMLMGAQLVGDFEVNYTRRDDTFVELYTRATRANDWQAEAFVSIHCNSGPPGQGTGFEVFTTVGDSPSDLLATDVFKSFGAEFPANARRVDMRDGDVDKEADFVVLRRTHCSAILFELEFIHTQAGESWLRDAHNQARCAKALAAGVRRFFGVKNGTDRTDRTDRTDGTYEDEMPLNVRIREAAANLNSLIAQLP